MFKQWKRESYVEAVLTLAAGILVLIFPTETRSVVCSVLAAAVALYGLYRIIDYFITPVEESVGYGFAFGLCLLAGGICAFIFRDEVARFLSLLLGAVLLVQGASGIQSAIDLLRIHQKGWWGMLPLAAVDIAFGIAVLCLFEKGFVFVLIGVAMIITAIARAGITLYLSFRFNPSQE